MAVVATRTAAANRGTSAHRPRRRSAGASGVRRRPRMRGALKYVLSIMLLVAVFGYVNVNANLTTTSYDKNDLMKQYRLERIKNERLKVELIRLSSPSYVVAEAERCGMVPAGRYDYLDTPETVASAGR